MFFCTLQKATRPDQIQAFIDGNPHIDVPRSYLENSDVYLLYHHQQIVGGFVYGLGPDFDTWREWATRSFRAGIASSFLNTA